MVKAIVLIIAIVVLVTGAVLFHKSLRPPHSYLNFCLGIELVMLGALVILGILGNDIKVKEEKEK